MAIPSSALSIFSFLTFLFLFIFSDFYYADIGRPFDYLAIVLIFLTFVFFRSHPPLQLRANAILLFALIVPWCIAGFWNESGLAAVAIMVGAGYVMPLSFFFVNAIGRVILDRSVFLMLFIGLAIFYLQSAVFVATGVFIDIPQMVGSIESRGLNEALGYFRPSGIFQEPNAYCTVMFCLGTLYAAAGSRRSWLETVLILSFFLSRSLWGFGAATVLIGLLYGWRFTAMGLVLLGMALAIYYLIFGIDLAGLAQSSTTIFRVFDIFNDASAQARFGQMSNFEMGTTLMIGSGVDTLNFQDFGANGIAFMLYCFGLGGTIAIALLYMLGFKIKLRTAISAVTLLTTYPPFSYMFFWFWLALMIVMEYRDYRPKSSPINSNSDIRIGSPAETKRQLYTLRNR
jgi:hypothetical protein